MCVCVTLSCLYACKGFYISHSRTASATRVRVRVRAQAPHRLVWVWTELAGLGVSEGPVCVPKPLTGVGVCIGVHVRASTPRSRGGVPG